LILSLKSLERNVEGRTTEEGGGGEGLNIKLNLDHVVSAGEQLADLLQREEGLALPTTRTPKGKAALCCESLLNECKGAQV
jgi:hypothetical protein